MGEEYGNLIKEKQKTQMKFKITGCLKLYQLGLSHL